MRVACPAEPRLIAQALLASDVNVKLVMQLRQQVKAKVAPTLGKSTSVKSVLQRAVFDELVTLVDPKAKDYTKRTITDRVRTVVG